MLTAVWVTYVAGIVPSALLLVALMAVSSHYDSNGKPAEWDDEDRLRWVRQGVPLCWFAACLWPVILPVLLCHYMSKRVIKRMEEVHNAKR